MYFFCLYQRGFGCILDPRIGIGSSFFFLVDESEHVFFCDDVVVVIVVVVVVVQAKHRRKKETLGVCVCFCFPDFFVRSLGSLEAAYFAGVRYLFCTEVVADVVGLELASCGGWGGLSCNVEPRVCIACEVHFQTLLGRKLLQLFLSWGVCVCVCFFLGWQIISRQTQLLVSNFGFL